MKNVFTSGMILFLAMTTTVSCTQENVMLETTPQVKNQEVRFCFFESSIVPIGQDEESNLARTRADGSEKSLKDAKLYTDLQVCLIPKGDETTAGYTVRQENWDDKFGNVSLQVPAGEYTLIAVAAKTDLQQEKRIEVKSRYEMTFANNIVRDMAYTLQDIKVETGSKAVTQNVSLKRAVSCFELQATEHHAADYQDSGNHDKRKLRHSVQSFYRILQRKCYHHPKLFFRSQSTPGKKHSLYTLHPSDRQRYNRHPYNSYGKRQGRKGYQDRQL